MSQNLSLSQTTRKIVTEHRGGVVAAQHRRAAEIGAEVLAAGGDAVDAAVAVSFTLGVVEPWMSGPAGGGAMVIRRADTGVAHAVNFGMRAPAGLDPADYPLAGTGRAGDLFPWEAVIEDRNVEGATAVAVPGVVDGIGRVHERFGTMPWGELLAPAIRAARAGTEIDWYTGLVIASAARSLARDADAAALFLEDGQWPPVGAWTRANDSRLPLDRMADTLETIAREGYRSFFEGDIAATIAADIAAKGGSLARSDLAGYEASIEAPLSFGHRDARLHAVDGLTAGPALRDACAALAARPAPGGAPGPEDYAAWAGALKDAYGARLAAAGDSPHAPGSTTHFSIVDRHGNMVSMTQTLLSLFGARVVSPGTGLLMNNGIMWFDPVPGRPNSLAPGKRCLMNVCPVILEQGGTRTALGASGGRKIVSAVAQLAMMMTEHGMSLEAAFHAPRIDMSGGDQVTVDETLSEPARARIARDHPVATARRTVFPYAFACPAAVRCDGARRSGCTEIMSPLGDAVAESD